ncbi:peptide chain release factor N(5)-glutamine methyltransferase [Paucibacter sp. Y2R2-4]|uniref:peptide chain release factor N(5)-glutamine methyltransferase n=1 Tax=Paucibacter sp. Y2R2-4 TaxID=2893553 RepID=UPI0021E3CCB4|nr:peptide chain release factor N(5)-glutamine methyltransferase [Paucibacter sp. Y2R2-4]MCV2349871.1 peptide chain release factor N(5)-glutamine methyltransferase [Paucibacter sp. Y2R2-4]
MKPLPGDVRAALQLAQSLGLDRLDAQLLVAAAVQQNRAWLISHDDAVLSPEVASLLTGQFAQKAAGTPLAYLLGEKEFHGLLLKVTPDTLVPRADTETLVDWALEILQTQAPAQARVVDLGTGSGAIALALKASHPEALVEALDLSHAALAVAQDNARRLGLVVAFHQGDWWQPLAGQQFDLIVSNPPYIAGEDPHLPALRHEPIGALTPGGDGLSDLQALIEGAPAHLQPGGWLLLEHGYDQAEPVAQALRQRGFSDLAMRRDLGSQPRVSGGRWLG